MIFGNRYSIAEDQRQNDEEIKCGTRESPVISKCPVETWVESMKFITRDDLDTMQLVSLKFNMIVNKYFRTYPFRTVNRGKIKSNKRDKSLKIRLVCLATSKRDARTLETNSDLTSWIRNCYVECIEFNNFRFTYKLIFKLEKMKQDTVRINYVVLSYDTKSSKPFPIKHSHIVGLFSVAAFKNCNGAVFSFGKRCSAFRPPIASIMGLPLTSMVVDFMDYRPTKEDCETIGKWLNKFQFEAPTTGMKPSIALSLREFNFNADSFLNLIESIQKEFVGSRKKLSFVMTVDYIDEWEISKERVNREVLNVATGEKLRVVMDGKVTFLRE